MSTSTLSQGSSQFLILYYKWTIPHVSETYSMEDTSLRPSCQCHKPCRKPPRLSYRHSKHQSKTLQGSVQCSHSFFDSKTQAPSLEPSRWLDSPSSWPADSKAIAGHALIKIKNLPCKKNTILTQNPMHLLFYENFVAAIQRDPLMNNSNSIDLFAEQTEMYTQKET